MKPIVSLRVEKVWVEEGYGNRWSILAGSHEADVGEIGVAYCKATADLFAASSDMLQALKLLVEVMSKFGEWDDGSFYYSGKSASELQGPFHLAVQAIRKAEDKS